MALGFPGRVRLAPLLDLPGDRCSALRPAAVMMTIPRSPSRFRRWKKGPPLRVAAHDAASDAHRVMVGQGRRCRLAATSVEPPAYGAVVVSYSLCAVAPAPEKWRLGAALSVFGLVIWACGGRAPEARAGREGTWAGPAPGPGRQLGRQLQRDRRVGKQLG